MPGFAWGLSDWLAARLTAQAERQTAPSSIEKEVTELFLELRAPLLRYLLSLRLPLADGEDLVQEVFLLLFHHLRQGKPRDNLRGWIFGVGHNLALKRRARNGRSLRLFDTEAQESACADSAPSPEELVAWNAKHERLQATVQALPERDRCCLVLRAEGLRYREIAAALGISLGSVAASLSRSLAKLSSVDQR